MQLILYEQQMFRVNLQITNIPENRRIHKKAYGKYVLRVTMDKCSDIIFISSFGVNNQFELHQKFWSTKPRCAQSHKILQLHVQ